MRSLFKLTLIILSFIPLYFAVTGVLGGAAALSLGDSVEAELDNQFRYLSAYYLSLFLCIWYVLGDIDKRGTVLRLLILAIFIGGLARLYSFVSLGAPSPLLTLAMALELGAPVLAIWHRFLERSPGPVVP
jgi:hypothetical protein